MTTKPTDTEARRALQLRGLLDSDNTAMQANVSHNTADAALNAARDAHTASDTVLLTRIRSELDRADHWRTLHADAVKVAARLQAALEYIADEYQLEPLDLEVANQALNRRR
jgi:hypothetical protein